MSKNKSPLAPIIIDKSSLAWKMFDAFVSDSQINVTEAELLSYASKDLNIHLANLPPDLIENLPMILVAFMNMWSGWHFKGEFLAGKFQKEHYFQRFQKFMIHKLNCTIRGQYANAVRSLGDLSKHSMKNIVDQEFLPYCISIQCPAQMLNTIVFSDVGDDIVMKQHLGSTWQELNLTQLLNWPHIEVTFSTPDLQFVRRQATEFVRYLNYLPHESHKHGEKKIEQVESWGQQECYSNDFLSKYVSVYLETLKSIPMASNLVHEVQIILLQFLKDIRDIDVNKSMVTNTAVLFRMSPVAFIRNKKLVKTPEKDTDSTRVGYCEIITPKLYLHLRHFKAQQLETPHLSFEYTDKMKQNATDRSIVIPKIVYKCTFCKVEFDDIHAKNHIMDHLKAEHKMEQHVRCTLCKKQFDVLNLTTCRWKHKCIPPSPVAMPFKTIVLKE